MQQHPSGPVLARIVLLSIFTLVLSLISMLWQHVASVAFGTAVEDAAYDTVEGKIGTAALVIGWFAVAMLAISCVRLTGCYMSTLVVEIFLER